MDLQFNDEDIKKHLHDLGYRNIPEGKLQTFVTDLRRLVKYEERKKLLDRKLDDLENVQPSPKLTERYFSNKFLSPRVVVVYIYIYIYIYSHISLVQFKYFNRSTSCMLTYISLVKIRHMLYSS